MTFEPGTQVEILIHGNWMGPYTVTGQVGRTPEHLVLSGPDGKFEHYNDAPHNTRQFRSEWLIRIRADKLLPGTRIIFSDDLGGEGEVVTVESATNLMGTIAVETEELDFTLEINHSTMVTVSND